ncbi:MAG: hypothetical protein SOY32_04390 [Candidatus Faecousia sp.]|nr:hypothetical protein [Bacillota bacterium]MDY4219642.1 hypothetical protein [Candidatus Faecousia sp.]
MSLNACRRICGILTAVAVILVVASLLLENNMLKMGLLGAALALILVSAVLRNRFWRCPKCGRVLSKSGPIHCSFCNWEEKE